jgi:hypothetical protein
LLLWKAISISSLRAVFHLRRLDLGLNGSLQILRVIDGEGQQLVGITVFKVSLLLQPVQVLDLIQVSLLEDIEVCWALLLGINATIA